jgi:glycosyltransferase involved in cell wall biosynthesis
MKPKISIIMPVYNSEKYLKDSIESIINQTFRDFEFIIINDGSTDNSLKIIKEYTKLDERIKIIDQKNTGVSYSRNMGIKKSTGEYVAFIDSDDIWLENKLELQLAEFILNKDLKICGTWAIVIDELGEEKRKFEYPPVDDKSIKLNSIYKNPFITSSVMIKKDILNPNELFKIDMRLAEDYEFITRYIHKNKCKNISKYIVKYRIHKNNSDNTLLKKMKFKIIAMKVRLVAILRLIEAIF